MTGARPWPGWLTPLPVFDKRTIASHTVRYSNMDKGKIPLSPEEFDRLWSTLERKLDDFLDEELEPFDPETTNTSESGVWGGMPAVDSKTVAKAAPIIEEVIGSPFDAKWIKPGGYESREEMKDQLKNTMRGNCVGKTKAESPATLSRIAARLEKK